MRGSRGRASRDAPIDSEATCPECGVDLDARARRPGRAFRCAGCGAWLYRGVWPRERGRALSCPSCGAPSGERMGCLHSRGRGRRPRPCLAPRRPRVLNWLRHLCGLAGDRAVIPVARIDSEGLPPRLSIEVRLFENLCRSIEEVGMIQPILVRPAGGGRKDRYTLISGHRRLLAARHLGWRAVPARVLRVTEAEALRVRLAENLHRQPLIPLELAEAFERCFLIEGEASREELAASLGIDAGTLRRLSALLKARPEERERMVYEGDAGGGEPAASANHITLSEIRRVLEETAEEPHVEPLR